MRTVYLHGDKVMSKQDLHQQLKVAFDFPAFYGNNLDALVDSLSARGKKELLVIKDSKFLEKQLGNYYAAFIRALKAVAAEIDFRFIIM